LKRRNSEKNQSETMQNEAKKIFFCFAKTSENEAKRDAFCFISLRRENLYLLKVLTLLFISYLGLGRGRLTMPYEKSAQYYGTPCTVYYIVYIHTVCGSLGNQWREGRENAGD
jgi:hypothetical protein